MRSWLLPRNKSASVTLPVGPSKTYSFSTLTQGSLRRCRFNASRSFESFFSFTRSFLRATSHTFCDTTLRFSIPRTVLIFGIPFSFVRLLLRSRHGASATKRTNVGWEALPHSPDVSPGTLHFDGGQRQRPP